MTDLPAGRPDPSPGRRRWRPGRRWGRLPLRIRLIAGFAAVMLLVLTGAGAFVYLRVQYALDLRLNEDLAAQTSQLAGLSRTGTLLPEANSDNLVPPGVLYQVLGPDNQVLAHSDGLTSQSLLSLEELARAIRAPLRDNRGALLPINDHPLRISATPIHADPTPAAGQPAVLVVAVRRDQRDEALRELIGQLALANLAALAVASFVGYRLTRAALAPVERYRTQAAEIAAGASHLRLAVPDDTHDEITRLGHTLNDMLAALDTALDTERRFVTDASHELRTPLTLLSTELELALRRPRSVAELEHTIRAAAHDTADLVALTDTLLAIGVQRSGAVAFAETDVSRLAGTAVDRYRATGTGPIIRAAITDGVTVRAEPGGITRIMNNLLDNALRHGAAPITVTVAAVGHAAVISVHDGGGGMPAEFLSRATGRFTRADAARTGIGTGLGLALVEAIIRRHDGELRLCSRSAHHRAAGRHLDAPCTHPPSGTTATVLIPATRAPGTATHL